jgi:hypothetical protein
LIRSSSILVTDKTREEEEEGGEESRFESELPSFSFSSRVALASGISS